MTRRRRHFSAMHGSRAGKPGCTRRHLTCCRSMPRRIATPNRQRTKTPEIDRLTTTAQKSGHDSFALLAASASTQTDEVMARDFPQFDVLASLEGRDDPELIERLMPEVLLANSNIVGIYSSAAGNEGLIRFFEQQEPKHKPIVIAHELTPLSRKALASGAFDAVISQDSGHLVRSAVRVMRANSDKTPINIAQERIRIDVYLKENMPP